MVVVVQMQQELLEWILVDLEQRQSLSLAQRRLQQEACHRAGWCCRMHAHATSTILCLSVLVGRYRVPCPEALVLSQTTWSTWRKTVELVMCRAIPMGVVVGV